MSQAIIFLQDMKNQGGLCGLVAKCLIYNNDILSVIKSRKAKKMLAIMDKNGNGDIIF